MTIVENNIKKYGKPVIKIFGKGKEKHLIYGWGKLKVIVDDIEEIEIHGYVKNIKQLKKTKK